jgi:hypothetical protein
LLPALQLKVECQAPLWRLALCCRSRIGAATGLARDAGALFLNPAKAGCETDSDFSWDHFVIPAEIIRL